MVLVLTSEGWGEAGWTRPGHGHVEHSPETQPRSVSLWNTVVVAASFRVPLIAVIPKHFHFVWKSSAGVYSPADIILPLNASLSIIYITTDSLTRSWCVNGGQWSSIIHQTRHLKHDAQCNECSPVDRSCCTHGYWRLINGKSFVTEKTTTKQLRFWQTTPIQKEINSCDNNTQP